MNLSAYLVGGRVTLFYATCQNNLTVYLHSTLKTREVQRKL